MIWKFEVRIRSILTGVTSCILIVMLSAWNTKDDLGDRNAILFYASKIPQLYKKKDPNVREFVTHKRTKIFFVHMNAPTKIDFFVSPTIVLVIHCGSSQAMMQYMLIAP